MKQLNEVYPLEQAINPKTDHAQDLFSVVFAISTHPTSYGMD